MCGMDYAGIVPTTVRTGDRQAPGSGRTSAAGKQPGAFFTSRIPFYDGAIGMASAMLVSHAGSWRTLSHRRQLDRQARGDGSSLHGRIVMSSILPIEQILVYGNMPSAVFYKTPAWRKVRYEALTIFGNRCQLCGSGPQKAQLHVDHIKPRFLYPESCLDIQNLQVLCEDCHIAKGVEYVDDCRNKITQLPAFEMRDILRLERWCLLLTMRPPRTKVEVEYWGDGVRSSNKKYRQRWRAFVRFCFIEKLNYDEARVMRLRDFLQTSQAYSLKFSKFTFGKKPEDFVFDIGGCLFPPSMYTLLADDQGCSGDRS